MRLVSGLAMTFTFIAFTSLSFADDSQKTAEPKKEDSKVVPASATSAVAVRKLTPSEAQAEDFLRYVNYARSLNGAGPLVVDANLMSLAASHTHWMASTGRFQHSSYGAENIGMGQRSVWEIYNSWWNSSGHRANLLGRGYTRVGLAYVNGYWTAIFQ